MALTAFIFGIAVSIVLLENKSSFKTVPLGPTCIMNIASAGPSKASSACRGLQSLSTTTRSDLSAFGVSPPAQRGNGGQILSKC